MIKKYRNNGAIGAILDEYEKSILEMKEVIEQLAPSDLSVIIDHETKDEDCRSIQTILSHVVSSGYTYVIEIRRWLGEQVDYIDKELLGSVEEYKLALDTMFMYNVQLFNDYPNIELEEYDAEKKFQVRWGQKYDVEQILEHAIVHVLRHRRQIERFKIVLASKTF